MEMIYILLLLEVIIFLGVFFFSDQDILAPGAIVCELWIISTLCAIYNISVWNINLLPKTVFFIVSGLLAFSAVSAIIFKCPKITLFDNNQKNTFGFKRNYQIQKPFDVSKIVLYGIILICMFTVFLQYRWVISTVGHLQSFGDMMNSYRSEQSTWNLEKAQKSFLHSNLSIFLDVSAYLTMYVGIYNIFNRNVFFKDKIKTFLYFVPGALYIIERLLNAGRGNILIYFGAVILTIYIVMQRKNNWNKKVSYNFIKYLVAAVFSLALFFSFSRYLVGRTNDSSFIDYITFYAGGSVELFDLYLRNPLPESEIWGKETFATLNRLLAHYLNKPELNYITHLEFRFSNYKNVGNVYGAFRYYYHDFGYIGILIMSGLTGGFFTFLYKLVKRNKSNSGFSWLVLFYIKFASSLFMYSVADMTYAMLFNIIGNIKWFIFAYIIKKFLIDMDFKLVWFSKTETEA